MYKHLFLEKNMRNEGDNDNTEITFEDSFDDDSSSSYSERKKLNLEKMSAKRKLEEYLENKRLEKEWNNY